MQDYLLFIDTEATGLPLKWTKPYTDSNNWPTAVQVAWIVFNKAGQELKRENFYISNNDVPITRQAQQIHQLNADYLRENGMPRAFVMQKIAEDLQTYSPLIVGHFVALDFHILGADFARSGLSSPLMRFPLFCTMLASEKYSRKPWVKYLRLGEFFSELFHKEMINAHNAIVDAETTSLCFFELQKRGDITDEMIASQQHKFDVQLALKNKSSGYLWIKFLLLVGLLILIIMIVT